ncbi:MAG: hypothetical protein IH987_17655 [Planctomycetes bacterium]|nr:hypothetical protein [Planctomycetota bacterium]
MDDYGHRSMHFRPTYAFTFSLVFFGLLCSRVDAIDEDLGQLVRKSRNLTETDVAAAEARLQAEPDNFELRALLVVYYFPFDAARRAHILWIIRERPHAEIAGSRYILLRPPGKRGAYEQARTLWLRHLEDKPGDLVILRHAARFFLPLDRFEAMELLRKARRLDPQNSEWSAKLGRLYRQDSTAYGGNLGPEIAALALQTFDSALVLADGMNRRPILLNVAQLAVILKKPEKARSHATELLDLAVEQTDGDDYGYFIHHGNHLLGLVALMDGQVDDAERFLLKAGRTPGSRKLGPLGPEMMLADELLKIGRKQVVIEYLTLCKKFWPGNDLTNWIATIEDGGTPKWRLYRWR